METNTNDDGRREITITMDEWTARRLEGLAWAHEQSVGDVARQCCRYGVLEYERALGVGGKTD